MTTKKEKKPNNRSILEFEKDTYAILRDMFESEKKKGYKPKIIELTSRICIEINQGYYDFLFPNREKKEEMNRHSVGIYSKPFKDLKAYTKGKFTHVTEMIERVLFFKKGKRLVQLEIEVDVANIDKLEEILANNGIDGVFTIRKSDY